jgi:hypothetical protein
MVIKMVQKTVYEFVCIGYVTKKLYSNKIIDIIKDYINSNKKLR